MGEVMGGAGRLQQNADTWWYTPPMAPMRCPYCAALQWWELPIDRRLRRKPHHTITDAPGSLDPTDLPAASMMADQRVNPSALPPPGWGFVECRGCTGRLVLVLCGWPGHPPPPHLHEISTAMFNFGIVQYRMSDDAQSGEQRWRTAIVVNQHDRDRLDLSVFLTPRDPEYHSAMLAGLSSVEARVKDDPDTGAERWRTAIISGRHGGRLLDLTVHSSSEDRDLKAWGRLQGAARGEAVGQWRYPAVSFTPSQSATKVTRGGNITQWRPINNT